MVRMSDILKKDKERKTEQERQAKSLLEPAKQKLSPEPVIEIASAESKAYEVKSPDVEVRKQEKAEISEVRISPIVMKEAKVAPNREGLNLYAGTASLMKEILEKNKNYEFIDTKRITTQTEKIVSQLSLNNEKLLPLALIEDWKDDDYLPYHSVNVCILSIEVGLGLGYSKPELIELGISALLHDIGMTEYVHLSNQPRKLTAEEYSQVKEHTVKGLEILKKNKNLNEKALHVARQHHMRLDGSGYPKELKGEIIDEYARIVGLVDEYETMTHHRAYRDKFLPLEAMQEILKRKKAFERRLIKILIEKIGIYPIGSLVELNTNEIAEVIKLNHSVHLNPVAKVKIIRDADGGKLKQTKVLDMTARSSLYIKKVVLKEN